MSKTTRWINRLFFLYSLPMLPTVENLVRSTNRLVKDRQCRETVPRWIFHHADPTTDLEALRLLDFNLLAIRGSTRYEDARPRQVQMDVYMQVACHFSTALTSLLIIPHLCSQEKDTKLASSTPAPTSSKQWHQSEAYSHSCSRVSQ